MRIKARSDRGGGSGDNTPGPPGTWAHTNFEIWARICILNFRTDKKNQILPMINSRWYTTRGELYGENRICNHVEFQSNYVFDR